MKAKTLLFSSCLKPEIVAAMVQAFDAAWADVGRHFSGPETNEARLVLVRSLLANAFDSHKPQETQPALDNWNDAALPLARSSRRAAQKGDP